MKRLEDAPSFANFPCDEQERLVYAEGRFVGYRGFDKLGGPTPLFRGCLWLLGSHSSLTCP